MSIENLEAMFRKADPTDLDEGLVAYDRYHLVMEKIAQRFGCGIATATAVFVALSPNSSYQQNLRSCVSVLDGALNRGVGPDGITVSTYGHCKVRAWHYAMQKSDFLSEVKGPKITAFYHNILDPSDPRWVTIDGHMSCIWQGKNLTMREALIPRSKYQEIARATCVLAYDHHLIPCQMQAVLWFVRKRVANVVYNPQMKLFGDRSDVWETFVDVDAIQPYAPRDPLKPSASEEWVPGITEEVGPSFADDWPAHEKPRDD